MKCIWVYAWIIGAALNAEAGFELAKGVYSHEALAEALTEAKTKNKPLAFLYSNTNSTCGLCAHASKLSMEEFRRQTVMVYVPHESLQRLPQAVQTAMNSEKAGPFIPKTVITDATADKVLTIVPYARSPEYDALLNRAEREMKKALADLSGVPAPGMLPRAQMPVVSAPPSELRLWRSAAGAEVEARLLRQTGALVVLEKADGKQVSIRLNELSEADRALLSAAPTR